VNFRHGVVGKNGICYNIEIKFQENAKVVGGENREIYIE
jgi:hypothetical protein